MPTDIFISYSRKDSEQALQLAELLRAAGMDVWIDQHGIAGAEQWATEIVEGIRACATFIVLLSPNSVKSENVLREVSLASEKHKRVLPVDLEPTILPSSFEYPLAGLQRVAISDFDSILRAHTHGVTRIVVKDNRKSLIVLPFEDLSPSGEDNGWFADGLAGEMIDALGHIKSLRILDRKTSIGLRGAKLRTVEIGKEFNTRYFIEGSVRKFGEQIKISVALLDIETGDYLWQESHRGEFKDIFDIQEAVAIKVVDGLKLHLTKEEKTLVQDRGTENTEAYELSIKGREYIHKQTQEGLQRAIQLLSEAIELDPKYVKAYSTKAVALANLYRNYDRKPVLLEEGMKLVKEALRLKPNLWTAYGPLSLIYQLQGNDKEAEQAAREYIQNAPDDYMSYSTLGMFYLLSDQGAKAIIPYEQAVKLNPEKDMITLMNLVLSCNEANEEGKRTYWATIAIPRFERHMKLFPEDDYARVRLASLFFYAGRNEEAREAARRLENIIKDGSSLYNIAYLQCSLQDYEAGIGTFRKAIEAGFRNTQLLNGFLSENEGVFALKGSPEYEEVYMMVEKIEAEQGAKSNA